MLHLNMDPVGNFPMVVVKMDQCHFDWPVIMEIDRVAIAASEIVVKMDFG